MRIEKQCVRLMKWLLPTRKIRKKKIKTICNGFSPSSWTQPNTKHISIIMCITGGVLNMNYDRLGKMYNAKIFYWYKTFINGIKINVLLHHFRLDHKTTHTHMHKTHTHTHIDTISWPKRLYCNYMDNEFTWGVHTKFKVCGWIDPKSMYLVSLEYIPSVVLLLLHRFGSFDISPKCLWNFKIL